MAGQSFPRSARLRSSSEFRILREKGKVYHGKLMVLSLFPNPTEGISRVGFITSRRVGGAVQRNRARRMMREAVRQDLARLPQNLMLVLIARTSVAMATLDAVQTDWRELLGKARICLNP